MSNLLASMSVAGNALDAFQNALSTTQNNVTNSSTAGYAKQTVNLTAQASNIADGLVGGVTAQSPIDSRDLYAEESVQQATQTLGLYTAQSDATSTLQSYFDVTGSSGLSSALTSLFQSFSSWSTSPSDTTARQSVLTAADTTAKAINSLDSSLSAEAGSLDTEIGSTVSQINTIETQIQQYNTQKLQQPGNDAGSDAQLYSALDSLSALVNFSTVTQSDGTVSVVLASGTPLVLGTETYPLSSNASVSSTPTPVYSSSPTSGHVLDSQGNDITSEISSGKLGGLLDIRNRVLGSILGDSQQQGSLNTLAQTLADTVNTILESGTVSSATGAASGSALFTYDTTNATNVAASIELNPDITTDQLAPVDSSGNSNGNANALAALENASGSATGTIGGLSMVEYFASIASAVGTENSTASDNETAQQQVVSTATTLRDTVSGVSQNQEAINLTAFEKDYQGAAQVLTTLDAMCTALMNMMPPAST